MGKFHTVAIAIVTTALFMMFSSCTYLGQVNYNKCVAESRTKGIATQCVSVR